MQKEKTLILIEEDSTSLLIDEYRKHNYNVDLFFKSVNKPLRAIRRLWIKNRLPKMDLWFGDWYSKLYKYDSLIINMNYLTKNTLDVVSSKNKDLRIIGWYWNTVDRSNCPFDYHNKNIEYWSFDDNDCKKYGFKKNIQYYLHTVIEKKEKVVDVYFVGRNKGRSEEILIIENILKNENISYEFNLIKDDNDLIPYNTVKDKVAKAKAVLEINKKNQIGLTLRAMESLFFGVKLITDNKAIKNIDFYNKSNVFIYGEDNIKDLKTFINGPYDHSVDSYREKYSVNTWFNNFGK